MPFRENAFKNSSFSYKTIITMDENAPLLKTVIKDTDEKQLAFGFEHLKLVAWY